MSPRLRYDHADHAPSVAPGFQSLLPTPKSVRVRGLTKLHSRSTGFVVAAMEPSFFIYKEPRPGSLQDRAHGTRALHEDGFKVGPAPRCPACDLFIGLLRWLPPYRVELEAWGKAFGDLMTIGDALLVSEHFKEVYEAASLTGLLGFEMVEVFKVRRHRKLIGEPPQYFVAEVVRSETAVDVVASEKEWDGGEAECPVCFHRKGGIYLRQKRVVIKSGTWTGHDIFHGRGGARFVASERMKETCDANGIKNAVWIPAAEYEVDYYPSKAKQVRRYLKDWEDRTLESAARQDAYRTLVFCVDKTRDRIPKGRFDPDEDADRSVIAAARALAAGDQ